jgi:hypothetical protein
MTKLDFNNEDKLEEAIVRWTDSLDIDQLVTYVQEDLWSYYTSSADEETALTFIQEMEIDL